MEKQGWKTAAIVSTILLVLSLIALGSIYFSGAVEVYHREVCAYDICGLDNGTSDAYFFAPDKNCFCYKEGEIHNIENMKDFLKG